MWYNWGSCFRYAIANSFERSNLGQESLLTCHGNFRDNFTQFSRWNLWSLSTRSHRWQLWNSSYTSQQIKTFARCVGGLKSQVPGFTKKLCSKSFLWKRTRHPPLKQRICWDLLRWWHKMTQPLRRMKHKTITKHNASTKQVSIVQRLFSLDPIVKHPHGNQKQERLRSQLAIPQWLESFFVFWGVWSPHRSDSPRFWGDFVSPQLLM